MAVPAYTSGKYARGICDVCGFSYKLNRLKDLYEKNRNTHMKACPTCWNTGHPQLHLGERPVHDPQALRDPRPDNREYASVRSYTILPTGLTMQCHLGAGSVSIS